jgi:4-diphosphocytidyl-2-C-methyl-D-erythritol kinase
VPFFLQCGTALGAGRGEELYPIDDVPRLSIVLIKPSFGIHAADAYRWLDEDRAWAAEAIDAPRAATAPMLDVGWPAGPVTLQNDLQGPVARRYPAIVEVLDALQRAGASAAAMTGSGSAVFGVFSSGVSRAAIRGLQRPDRLVLLTRTSTRREAARHMGL